jgi:hypothetical protein
VIDVVSLANSPSYWTFQWHFFGRSKQFLADGDQSCVHLVYSLARSQPGKFPHSRCLLVCVNYPYWIMVVFFKPQCDSCNSSLFLLLEVQSYMEIDIQDCPLSMLGGYDLWMNQAPDLVISNKCYMSSLCPWAFNQISEVMLTWLCGNNYKPTQCRSVCDEWT